MFLEPIQNGSAELVLLQVLKRIKSPTQQGSDGRSALHLLYHYCNKPRDLARCTALLLEAGLDPNLPDSEGNPPLFYLLKHTFVKRSYIRYTRRVAQSKDWREWLSLEQTTQHKPEPTGKVSISRLQFSGSH